MNKKHFNIPVFIPDLACPFRCIYCHQPKISGKSHLPTDDEIQTTIEKYLSTIPVGSAEVEIAFFGGNFTGLHIEDQKVFLELVQPYIKSKKVSGIRISTRPDFINNEIVSLLKSYGVVCIELGAQSMDNEVLIASMRGHLVEDTIEAAHLIRKNGIKLGLQMMIGLPGDTYDKAMASCMKIIDLQPDCTRLYPTLVIRDTYLETLYRSGKYNPLNLNEAIEWSKNIFLAFEAAGITLLKAGLHPVSGLVNGSDLVAGPFHPSFRELVLTEIWADLLTPLTSNVKKTKCHIYTAKEQVNHAAGFNSKNRKLLSDYFTQVNFSADNHLKNKEFYAHIS